MEEELPVEVHSEVVVLPLQQVDVRRAISSGLHDTLSESVPFSLPENLLFCLFLVCWFEEFCACQELHLETALNVVNRDTGATTAQITSDSLFSVGFKKTWTTAVSTEPCIRLLGTGSKFL